MEIYRRLKQLLTLTMFEWQVLLLSILLLPIIDLALKLKGFKRTQAMLSSYLPKKPNKPISEEQQLKMAQAVAHMVFVAANHGPFRANCLKKSLLIWSLLQQRGVVAQLNLGVNKEGGDFNAHAWVEWKGIVLVDLADVRKRFSAFNLH